MDNMVAPINATGWSDLLGGHIVTASFATWTHALSGWFIPLLFITYQIIAFYKTKSVTPGFFGGIIMTFVYHVYMSGFSTVTHWTPLYVMYAISAIELGIMIYGWINK